MDKDIKATAAQPETLDDAALDAAQGGATQVAAVKTIRLGDGSVRPVGFVEEVQEEV